LTLIREGKDKVEMREEGLQLTSHAITAQSQALKQNFRSQRGSLEQKAGLSTEFL